MSQLLSLLLSSLSLNATMACAAVCLQTVPPLPRCLAWVATTTAPQLTGKFLEMAGMRKQSLAEAAEVAKCGEYDIIVWYYCPHLSATTYYFFHCASCGFNSRKTTPPLAVSYRLRGGEYKDPIASPCGILLRLSADTLLPTI